MEASIASQQDKTSSAAPMTLAPFSNPIFAAAMSGLTVLLLVFFNQFPDIDLAVAGFFFSALDCDQAAQGAIVCGSFTASEGAALNTVRNVLHVTPVVVAIALAVAAVIATRRGGEGARRFARGAALAITSLVLCSLVIVNLVLKAYSGRPRPYQTDVFGGDLPFVPAGVFTDLCQSNCSFVSGEASAAFWLLCLFPLVAVRHRPAAFIVTLIVAVTASMLRVAFGGHYLSDAMIAASLSLAVFACLASVAVGLGLFSPAVAHAPRAHAHSPSTKR